MVSVPSAADLQQRTAHQGRARLRLPANLRAPRSDRRERRLDGFDARYFVSRAALNDPRIRVLTQTQLRHAIKSPGTPASGITHGKSFAFWMETMSSIRTRCDVAWEAFEANPSLEFLFHDMRYMNEAGRSPQRGAEESHLLTKRASVRPTALVRRTTSRRVFPDSNLLASSDASANFISDAECHGSASAAGRPDSMVPRGFADRRRLRPGRIRRRSGAMGYLDEILSARRMHEQSITRRPDNPIWVLTARTRAYDYTAGFFSLLRGKPSVKE